MPAISIDFDVSSELMTMILVFFSDTMRFPSFDALSLTAQKDLSAAYTYIHHLGSPGRLALWLEHVDHDVVVDVVACVRVDLGHDRTCVTSLSS